jgi:hypothetical protein
MTERRYGFRFSAVEAGLLVVSTVLTSVFVFVAGVYVGKGVEAHKTAQLTPPVRMPLQIPDELRPAATKTPLTWPPPKDKPVGDAPSVATVTTGTPVQTPNPFTQENTTKKALTTDFPPGKHQALPPAEKSQAKTAELSQSPSTKRSAGVEESTSSSRTAAVQSLSTENPAEARETSSPAQKAAKRAKGWRVQVEATSREETAQEIARALRAQGYDSSVSKVTKQGEVLYRVRVGRFTTQDEAVAAIARFRREGKFSQAYPVSE